MSKFKVSKTYLIKKTVTGYLDGKLVQILYITDMGSVVARWLDCGKEVIWSPEVQFNDWIVEEYIPPPPEEWRAVFYREHGKPEISAAIYPSKESCEKDYEDVSKSRKNEFLGAIRTDKGALKNGN